MITTEAPEATTNASGKNRWFQLGLMTAGAVAPLIARWRSLRAAEQAEALREQASERLNEALAWVAQSRPQETLQETLRQAGPQAQESLRQVSVAAREALRRLPGASPAAEAPAPAPVPEPTKRRANATLWAVGVGVGLVAAGAIAYIVLRNRMSAASDDDALVEIPLTVITAAEAQTQAQAVAQTEAQATAEAAAAATASEGPAIVEESPEDEPGIAEPMTFNEEDAAGAAFVGNILSRIYHPSDSRRLPAPRNRIYFATEEEAVAAGYRPDSAELASHSSDTSAPQQ